MQGTDTKVRLIASEYFSGFPDNGQMPWVNNWQAFEGLFRRLSATSMIDSIKDLQDIRPSPRWYRGSAGDGYAADARPRDKHCRADPVASTGC